MPEHESAYQPEKEPEKKPEFDDPKEFVEAFRNSEEYKHAFRHREEVLKEHWKKERPTELFPEDEKSKEIRRHFFEDSEYCEQALASFGHRVGLKFNPEKIPEPYCQPIKNLLSAYWELNRRKASSLRLGNRSNVFRFQWEGKDFSVDVADEKRYDEVRSQLHREIARKLVEAGLVPNERWARWMVIFFTEAEGIHVKSPSTKERIQTEAYNAPYRSLNE